MRTRSIAIALVLALTIPCIFAAQLYMKPRGNHYVFYKDKGDSNKILDIDADAGTVSFPNNSLRPTLKVITYDTTATARTITRAESGCTFVMTTASSDDPVTNNLPIPEAGDIFHFIDNNPTADADYKLKAPTGVKINGGTAAKIYQCTGDAVKQSCTLLAISATEYIVLSELGTWSNDNS